MPGTPATAADWASSRGAWRTLRAVQHVDVTLADGSRHTMRALLAIERPDKFRLRALGPGGVTLFDVVSVAGKATILEAIKGASAGKLAVVVGGMAGDIAAAYDLAPRPPDRRIATRDARTVAVDEPGRTVTLDDFRSDARGRVFPGAIHVDSAAGKYRVDIRTSEATLDEPLDPALFETR